MNLMICHDWSASHMKCPVYNAQSNRSHPPTSPNTAPATKNESHDWSASHMKCPVQCAKQQGSSSNFTKYCACHEKWISWLIRVAYETSFTMCGATGVIRQAHQILRLPPKMNLMMDQRHIWNVQYITQSNKSHPPTSPNIAPATKFWIQDFSGKPLNCFSQYKDDVDHDPRIIRRYPTIKSSSRTRHFGDLTGPILQTHLVWKNTTFRAPTISQNCTKCCACHEKWHSKSTKYCACHEKWISWLIRVTYETSFTFRGATGVILQLHQILHLPRKMNLMIEQRHIWNPLTLLYCTLLYSIRLDSTVLYSSLLYSTRLYYSLLYGSLLYYSLLYYSLLY